MFFYIYIKVLGLAENIRIGLLLAYFLGLTGNGDGELENVLSWDWGSVARLIPWTFFICKWVYKMASPGPLHAIFTIIFPIKRLRATYSQSTI